MIHQRYTKSESKGTMLILASTVFFCLMSALVRYASDIDPYKTTLFRFVVGLGILGTAALFGRIKLKFVNGPLLFLRGLFGGAAILLCFFSIAKLGVGKGTVLIYSFPIFTSIFSVIFLKEKIGLVKIAAILAAFFGIYLLACDNGESSALLNFLGRNELLAVLGAVLGGLALVIVKKLHDTDSSYAIYFAQCAIGLWIVAVPANIVPCSIGFSGGLLLVAIGATATIGQLLSTEAYRYVEISTGSLLGMLVPVLNYIVGVTIFDEFVSWKSVIGATAIVGACVIVLVKNNKD
ncbi:MAG: DMT family transporter [Sedimentisphaerales bacterium]|nr:DMT family transporter [Sedimentisphaerales bacterium]